MEVDGVGDHDRDQAEAEKDEVAAPADDHGCRRGTAEHHHVADRIGGVDDRRRGIGGGEGGERGAEQRGSDRGRAGGGDCAVEGERAGDLAADARRKCENAGSDEREVGEVERVTDRRIWLVGVARVKQRVEDVAGGPADDAGGDQAPGEAIAGDQRRAQDAGERARDEHPVVDPVVGELVELGAVLPEHRDRVDDRGDGDQGEQGRDRNPGAASDLRSRRLFTFLHPLFIGRLRGRLEAGRHHRL
jgi:hypothetical protein